MKEFDYYEKHDSFNRTKVECKSLRATYKYFIKFTFNRTKVECKLP